MIEVMVAIAVGVGLMMVLKVGMNKGQSSRVDNDGFTSGREVKTGK